MEIDIVALCRRFMEIGAAQDAEIPENWHINSEAMCPCYCDIMLDAMGVPADNTIEMVAEYGDEQAEVLPGYFARDYLMDSWMEAEVGEITPEEFVRRAMDARQEYEAMCLMLEVPE